MIDLKKLTIEQLHDLKAEIEKEISNRSDFDEEFQIGLKKAYKGVTRKQYELAVHLSRKTDSQILKNGSQIEKYMEAEEMDKAISLMKNGKKIKIH